MIYILTGNIQTGKTTTILEWITSRTDVDGVLCPEDEFGKRYFLKIKSKEILPLEVENDVIETIISIGNFKFLKTSFEKANAYLMTSLKQQKYLIIDELGKLELKNEGLHQSAKKLIKDFQFDKNHHLMLVVRRSLLENILNHYEIQNCKILSKNDLRKEGLA